MAIRPFRAAAMWALTNLCVFTCAQGRLSISSESTWASKYLWRGLIVDSKPTLQSSNTFSLGDYSLNVWTSKKARDAFQVNAGSEVDVSLARGYSRGRLGLSPSIVVYAYPGLGTPTTAETSVDFSYDAGGFELYTNHFLDFVSNSGGYYGELGVGFDRHATRDLDWGGAFTLGWGNRRFHAYNFGTGSDCLSSASAQLYCSFRLSGALRVRPSLTCCDLLNSAVRGSAPSPSSVVWGVTVGIEK